MIRLNICGFVFFAISCGAMQKDAPERFNTKTISNEWKLSTIRALDSINRFLPSLEEKIAIIKESLSNSSKGVDYLDRDSFLTKLKSYLDTFSIRDEMMVVELRESGESIVNTKALIGFKKNRILVFERDYSGNWIMKSSSFLTVEQVNLLRSIALLPNSDKNYTWGLNINDCLIISEIRSDEIRVTPVLLAKNESINLIRGLLSLN